MSGSDGTRWTQVVAVAVPLACFTAARWVLDAGPAVAPGASSTVAASAVAPAAVREPTHEQRRAAEWARERSASRSLRSPMTRGVPTVPDPEPAPAEAPVTEPPPPPPDPAALFIVTSLLEAGAKQLATINGVTYAPGDEFAPGYRLERVHGHRRVALISCPDGSTVELRPRP